MWFSGMTIERVCKPPSWPCPEVLCNVCCLLRALAIQDIDEFDGCTFIAMELLDGDTLQQILGSPETSRAHYFAACPLADNILKVTSPI